MHPIFEFLVSLFVIIGGAFIFVGSLGLIKLRTFMARLHGPSKATTLGVGGCLLASTIQMWGLHATVSIQEVLVTFFLFITAPVTAHFIAKAFLHSAEKTAQNLPQPNGETGWSTFESVQKPVVK